jgi:hypothetical protein
MNSIMYKYSFVIILLFAGLFQKARGADLVIVINTLECSNYYRSASFLTDLKNNFDIRFIFPEYESKLAVKYLDEKFNLKWEKYEIEFNDSLYNGYRKNKISECVYFPNDSKNPLFSFPLSQLAYSVDILKSIPGKIKTDTIPVDPNFLFTGDMSFAFDSVNVYMLDAQFGSMLELNKKTYGQRIFHLPDSFQYDVVRKAVLTTEEIKDDYAIEGELKDQRSFINRVINFQHIGYFGKHLYIKASVEYYKKTDQDKVGIYSRIFIMRVDPANLSKREYIIYPHTEDFYHSYAPPFAMGDTICLPMGIQKSLELKPDKKYLISKYLYNGKELTFLNFDPVNCLPEEHTRLNLNYNFLNYYTYKNYFSFPYTKKIYGLNGKTFEIKLLPEVDTIAGSKFPEVKTNYMKLSFAVEYPIVNFITKFDDGTVKLFSYDYSNNLPFNQITLPMKIKTLWPEEDLFKFISINSFMHINLRNQYIVKYYW